MARTRWLPLSLCFTVCIAAAPAFAQPDDDPFAGDEVELEPEGEVGDEFDLDAPPDAREVPGDPVHAEGARGQGEAGPAQRGPYPIEVADRPITLYGGMSEVFLLIDGRVEPSGAYGWLRGSYGITDQIQLNLRYGLGAVGDDGFITGKVGAIGGRYQLTNWASVELEIPIMFDPFALGVVLGAPLEIQPFEGFELRFGRDLLGIRLAEFIPDVEDAARSDALAALSDIGTTMNDVVLSFIGGAVYQLRPNLALQGEVGIIAPLGGSSSGAGASGARKTEVPLRAILWYSSTNKLDLGVRAGFSDLGEGVDGLFGGVFAALRI